VPVVTPATLRTFFQKHDPTIGDSAEDFPANTSLLADSALKLPALEDTGQLTRDPA
jgi:hypothetical protein